MKLYKVILTYETVILTDTEEEALWEAEYAIKKGDETPVNVEISEIESLDDLPEGWDENCRPWGETDQQNRTIGEIIRDQNQKNEIKNEKEYKMKPFYYVYRIDGQAPQKAHPTLESAHQEAIRLALMYPDARIEILKCLGFAQSKAVEVTWAEEAGR